MYLSNFWRSLEMPLINCKVDLELNWIEDCILSSDGNSVKFEIAYAKLHVLIVPFYWSSYQTKPAKVIEKVKNLYELLNLSFQGVRSLFVLAYVIAAGAANDEAGIKTIKSIFFEEERLIITTY